MPDNVQAECVLEPDNYLGETPLWSAEEQVLYWVNCEQPPEIHRWNPATGEHLSWPMPERIGGIALRPGGRLLVVLSHGIHDFDPASGELSLCVPSPLPGHVSLHECQCDRQGRLWVGAYDHHFSPDNREAREGVISLLVGGELRPMIPGISVANGMAVSPDGRRLYVGDSATRTVQAFDLDPASGDISNQREFLRLPDGEGHIDGATVDAEGGYWLAAVGAGALRRYLPDGTLDRVIDLPVSNPTRPAFGGADLSTLYVTTTRMPLGPGAEANGGLYALRPGMAGLAEPLLASLAAPDAANK